MNDLYAFPGKTFYMQAVSWTVIKPLFEGSLGWLCISEENKELVIYDGEIEDADREALCTQKTDTPSSSKNSVKKRGRPVGTPGGGKYNCSTVPVRVPVDCKDNIVKIIDLYKALKAKKEDWEDRISDAARESKNGKPSPRYDRAIELLKELEELL